MKKRRGRQWFVDAGAVLTALVFLVPVGLLLAQEQRLSTDSQIATGVVQGKAHVAGGNDSSPDYYVLYSVTDASGREHAGRKLIEYSLYEKVSPGDPLSIQYLVDEPDTSRIAGAYNPTIPEALALAAVGLVFFYFLGPQRWLRELRGKPDPVLT
jgi:hypothetical protein